jgi:hypothetical protein
MTEVKMLDQCPFDPTIEANCMVFGYLKNLSAHPDLSEILVKSVRPLGDVQIYSPDFSNCRYVTVSTQRIIFGFAIGTNTIAFRLNDRMKAVAIKTGEKTFPECGADWVEFSFGGRGEWPKIDWDFWALKAYVNIRESVGLA